jgi:hypothetical protein
MLPMWEKLSHIVVPVIVAVLLTLLFFIVFDWWDNLDNPVASIVTPLFGIVGFAVGLGVDRWRLKRGRTQNAGNTPPLLSA